MVFRTSIWGLGPLFGGKAQQMLPIATGLGTSLVVAPLLHLTKLRM